MKTWLIKESQINVSIQNSSFGVIAIAKVKIDENIGRSLNK